MSQQEASDQQRAADDRAAAAVVAHHAQLARDLDTRIEAVLTAAEHGAAGGVAEARADLVTWLNTELMPHARAEETALYPAAAVKSQGALLIAGMLDEHRTIAGLVAELERDTTPPVRVAGAARALGMVFASHLTKENELVLPLLVEAPEVSVADLLGGMHELLGAQSAPASGGGCGGGGACGCGGDTGRADADAPMLTIDPRLDVRDIPHGRQRHAYVLSALAAVPAGQALVLIAPHAPRPLLAEIEQRFPEQFDLEWLQEGPDVWQLRLYRAYALV